MIEFHGAYSIAIFIIILSFVTVYMKWSLSHWKRRNIPYLEPSIPFGNFHNPFVNKLSLAAHFQEFHKKIKEMGAKGGGIYAYICPIFMPVDPKYIKHVLVQNFHNFSARGFYYNEKDQPISAFIGTIDGDKWRILRTKMTPNFTSTKMKLIFNLMVKASKIMEEHVEEHISKGIPLNARDCASRFTTDLTASCAFGLECNSFKDNTFYKLLEDLLLGTFSFAKVIFCNAFQNMARFLGVPFYPKKHAEILESLIDETIIYRKENIVTRNDFLQVLLEMLDKDKININELKAECFMFFLSGYETSAVTITFFLFELALNQNIQEKLREEIFRILELYNGEITYDAIMHMKYLNMVLCEVLRKYPPIPMINRKCVKDFTFPNSNIIIEKDTNLVISIFGLHYDAEYFPEPNKFDPERFSEENERKILPFSFIPFGEGPRDCIGKVFGKQEIKVGITNLIRKYKFKLNPNVKVPLEMDTGVITFPKQAILLDIETV